ncbi:UvrD-helicase domain-containing protein [Pseudanabaena mucicola]|uniref:DNA 3'-5' helicase n=1 Tax=Pseudanabaena mucicola FACHB-723 TaxID=2692860 RepID=A0ABR7ZT03_9CYAN|nr:UvrD-helicase domain-containing protein [Pseudanabaena mucicola]MBD2186590.1 UvrD-helicase domain-containing protein [Pseudanabaena mucicola FACHB-723]
MSKAMINSLIDEINSLLSRPVGSVTEKVSLDIAHPRDQLKRLRSHLEKLTEDKHLNNLDQQYQGLVAHLQEKISINRQTSHNISTESKKLEILPPTTIKSEASHLFGDTFDLNLVTNKIAVIEKDSTFLNDCMITPCQQLMNTKIETVQDFYKTIVGYEESWELLTGREVKRIKPRVLRASGDMVLIDEEGCKTQKFEYINWKIKRITVLSKRIFIAVAYSGYEPIAKNIITHHQKRISIDEAEYKKDEFVNLFKEIYPPITLDEINSYKQKKDLLIEQIQNTLREDYIRTDKFYELNYKLYVKVHVHQFEYRDIKQNFIQSWTEANIKNKPDLEQSLAIGSVNSHVQLIARAGSGKTSTLVNRAIFLQKHCGIKPSEILLLAFNRKAAHEIRERLQKHLQNDLPYVMTFHALAYHLVHPDETLIFDEPDGQQTKSRSLQSVIDEYIRNPNYSEQIKSLMIAKFRKVWIRIAEGGYDLTPEEMIEYRRSLPQVGIDGYNYKSGGEKIIADFLFEHNIPFKYEKNFWWRGVNYHPDFTVLKEVNGKKGIVIEYFGLQGDPNYDEQSQQKRYYWEEEQSDYLFIELNPAILKPHGREGMENHLRELLTGLGLELNRLSTPEIWERVKDRVIDDFTKSMTNFIGRCRKQCLTPDQLSEKIERYFKSNPQTSEPEFQFLDLAQNFYISYLDRLQQTGEEDFDGLMQRAAKVVDEGNTVFLSSKFRGDLKELKYIMIDEYQDFSLLFHNLITAIRKQNPEALFFCVGDDWQAINGFAGADLHYYNNFTQIFTPSHTLPITTNYRSGSQIVEIGNQLMTDKGIPAKSSTQLQGKIQLVNIAKFQMTAIEEEEHGYDLTAAIIRLIGQLIQEGKQVALLSKKNTLQGVDRQIKELDKFRKYILKKLNLVGELEQLIEISTTHKYKGKERQAVIILDAYNYPTIHPSSIFFRIFGDNENKLIADDRRLFYVALTRAKEELYLVVDSFKMSPFVAGLTSKMQLQELDWKDYPVVTIETRFITVKVTNQQGRGKNPTIAIKELLKSEGYKYNGTSISWNKVEPVQKFLADGSRLQYLSDRNWSSQANGIEVNFCNEQEEVISSYLANNGKWTCSFDNFKQSKIDEPDITNYDEIPF